MELVLLLVSLHFAQPDVAMAVVLAESGGDPHQVTQDVGSYDRGLWQFNSRWHAEVDNACAFDLYCASREAYRVSKGGTDWHEWAAYTAGSYLRYLPFARKSLMSIGMVDIYDTRRAARCFLP